MYIIKPKGSCTVLLHIETRERKTEREFTQKETLKKGLREREREREGCIIILIPIHQSK